MGKALLWVLKLQRQFFLNSNQEDLEQDREESRMIFVDRCSWMLVSFTRTGLMEKGSGFGAERGMLSLEVLVVIHIEIYAS